MNRKSDHVLSYVLAELGTNGSIDGNNRLVIKGRFQPKQIENVVRHYIAEYVACRTCKSPDTELVGILSCGSLYRRRKTGSISWFVRVVDPSDRLQPSRRVSKPRSDAVASKHDACMLRLCLCLG